MKTAQEFLDYIEAHGFDPAKREDADGYLGILNEKHQNIGYDEGYDSGYEDGRNDCDDNYDEGYRDGVEEGKSEC